jgi:hypothetical protein
MYPYKKSILNYNFAEKGTKYPQMQGYPLAFLSYEEPYLDTLLGKLAQKGFILA